MGNSRRSEIEFILNITNVSTLSKFETLTKFSKNRKALLTKGFSVFISVVASILAMTNFAHKLYLLCFCQFI